MQLSWIVPGTQRHTKAYFVVKNCSQTIDITNVGNREQRRDSRRGICHLCLNQVKHRMLIKDLVAIPEICELIAIFIPYDFYSFLAVLVDA